MLQDPALANSLERFIEAQNADDSFLHALSELESGQKVTHWIWWVFPQLRDLGRSSRAEYYGITGREEAREYLLDPTLAFRLEQAVRIVLDLDQTDPVAIFGEVDAQKFQSCLTLFEAVADEPDLFTQGLSKFYQNQADPQTLQRL